MSNALQTRAPATASKAMRWTGVALSSVFTLFVAMDFSIKLARMKFVDSSMIELGYQPGLGFMIGAIELVLMILYLVPRTAILGAVLLTGLFGGAIAAHLRIGSPFLTYDLLSIYLGFFAWGGLWLRDERLREIFPFR